MTVLRHFSILLAAFFLISHNVQAQTQALTAEALAQDATITQVRLSPKATQFAAWVNRKESGSLIVRGLNGGEKARILLTSDAERLNVNWFLWTGEDRLLVSVSYPKAQEIHLLSVPVDGSKIVALISPQAFPSNYTINADFGYITDLMPEDGNHILVQLNGASFGFAPDIYEIDLRTGSHRTVHPGSRGVHKWMTDAQHRVRVSIGGDEDDTEVRVRPANSETWRTAWRFGKNAKEAVVPMGFAADPDVLYVHARRNGRVAVFEVNVNEPTLTLKPVLMSDTRHVAGWLVVDARTGRAVGVNSIVDGANLFWAPEYLALFKSIEQALPGRRNRLLQWSDDGKRYLVESQGGNQPRQFLVGNVQTGDLAFLADSRPDLDPDKLAKTTDLTLRARNGVDLPATLTAPMGAAKKPWPVVIIPNFFSLEPREFDLFAQLLASRGIAVMDLGVRDYLKADPDKSQLNGRLWFSETYQDVSDAAAYLVTQGIADPQRICAAGRGYEVHASLLAAADMGKALRCVVGWNSVPDPLTVGVANIKLPSSASFIDDFRNRIQWEDELKAHSPLRSISTIKANVLLAVEDMWSTAIQRQTNEMEIALRSADVPVKVLRIKYDKDLKPNRLRLERRTKEFQVMSDYLVEQLHP